MRDLAILERAVLHRGQQVLEPEQLPRIELVPEDERHLALEGAVAYLMKETMQFAGRGEL